MQVMLIDILKMMGLTLAPVFAVAVVVGSSIQYYASGLYVFNRIHSI